MYIQKVFTEEKNYGDFYFFMSVGSDYGVIKLDILIFPLLKKPLTLIKQKKIRHEF